MQEHEKRVVTEKEELTKKLLALLGFVETDTFKSLEQEDRELLLEQLELMKQYEVILVVRIERFD
ncbi:MAG: hypothetical protein JKY89_13310 [Immundisolibacteraceae bacterium]|nr:hypothetical protein [Immundisolibacteraceae bacterium]